MELVRIVVQAPIDGEVWTIAVSPVSQVFDLGDQQRYPGLAQAIQGGTPLVIEAETSAVYYRFSQASGVVDPNAMSSNAVGVGTGALQLLGHVKFPGVPAIQAESVPAPYTQLIARTATATGVLRIKAVG